jgi:hypothetical protein
VCVWLYVRLSECRQVRGTGASCQNNSRLPPAWGGGRKRRQWDSLVVGNGASTHAQREREREREHVRMHGTTYSRSRQVTMFPCMCVGRSVRFVAQLNRRDPLLLANASPTLAARARCVSFCPSRPSSYTCASSLHNSIQTHWPFPAIATSECVCVCV